MPTTDTRRLSHLLWQMETELSQFEPLGGLSPQAAILAGIVYAVERIEEIITENGSFRGDPLPEK